MNRLTFTIMLKKLIELYLNDGFNFDDFKAIVDNTKNVKFDENIVVLLETEILYSLFQIFPYYKVENELRHFMTYLTNTTVKNDNYYRNARMIRSCLEDLIPTVKRIVIIAAQENLLKLINTFYNLDNFDSNMIIQSFLVNYSNPSIITGAYVARDYFSQYEFSEIKKEPVNLREKVSKTRDNKNKSLNKELRVDVLKHYNEQSLETFITKIKEAITESSFEEKEELKYIVFSIVDNLYIYAVPKWQKDDYQLTLKF